jgi:uncharacterized protein YciI
MMAQFLYKIQPVRPEMLTEGSTETESRTVSEHFSYLKSLMEKGVVILAGRTLNTEYSSFGIVLFNAESMESARRIMLDDPAVKNRVFRGEIYTYSISLLKAENAE